MRCRSPACRRAGPRRCSAAASRSRRCCRRPTPASRSSFASTCPRMPRWARTNLTVTAKGARPTSRLPVAVTLAKDLPAKLTLEPQLPELRGTSKSTFEYQLDVKNDSGKQIVVEPRGDRAAEFRGLLHRAVRQPGAQRRCRSMPASRRTSSSRSARRTRSAPARYKVTATRHRRGRHRRQPSSASTSPASRRSSSPAAKACSARARRPARRPRSRSSSPTPAPRRPKQVELSGSGAERLEGRVRSEDDRPHRAEREQGSAGAASRRPPRRWPATTSPTHARLGARRNRVADLPRRGRDLDACGASSAPASSASRCSSWSARWRGSAGDERQRHRGARPHQALRRGCRSSTASRSRWRSGEIFGLLGPNGAGKTTTILMMLGLTEIIGRAGARARLRSGARAAAGQAPGRLSARHGRLLRQHDRGRQPALHRRA